MPRAASAAALVTVAASPPSVRPPPGIHNITGSRSPALRGGVQTVSVRQSSLTPPWGENSPVQGPQPLAEMFWVQLGPKAVAPPHAAPAPGRTRGPPAQVAGRRGGVGQAVEHRHAAGQRHPLGHALRHGRSRPGQRQARRGERQQHRGEQGLHPAAACRAARRFWRQRSTGRSISSMMAIEMAKVPPIAIQIGNGGLKVSTRPMTISWLR